MIDFENIEKTVLAGFEEAMRQTPQPVKYHGEGDVFTHTMMVYEALLSLPEYQSLNERQRHILNIASLLHDVGKIATTIFSAGELESPHHAPRGSHMARELLWKDYGLCGDRELKQVREAICLLIRFHSFPPHAIDDGGALRLHRISSNGLLVPDFSLRMLCILAKADMLGRRCEDQGLMLDQIALCEELAREEDCLDGPFNFPSPVTRRAFLSGQQVWKRQEVFDETWGEVILMSGLPGTGKDTWINKNCAGLPVISLDEIRSEMNVAPTEEQGYVASICRERAKEFLRNHQPFVWNATNITAQMRESLVGLFETYHAHVRIIYLETDWQQQLQRNASREDAVPVIAIESMLGKLVPPEPFEARTVEWINV